MSVDRPIGTVRYKKVDDRKWRDGDDIRSLVCIIAYLNFTTAVFFICIVYDIDVI